MTPRRLLVWSLLTLSLTHAPLAHALVAPQDNWRSYPTSSWTFPGAARSVTVSAADEVYVAVANTSGELAIEVFSTTGTPLRRFLTLPSGTSVGGMDFDSTGNLVVLVTSARLVQVYDPSGVKLREWGGSGTGNGTFGSLSSANVSLIALDADDQVYVADHGNRLVQKFSPTGDFLLQWGGPGTLAGQFGTSGAMAIGVTPQNNIVVAAMVTGRLLQLFDQNGALIAMPSLSGSLTGSSTLMAIQPDGVIALSRLTSISLFGSDFSSVGQSFSAGATHGGIGVGARGDFFLSSYASDGNGGTLGKVTRFERSYLVENPPVANALPLPVLLSAEQRPSTPYVDIDYKVVDADDATADVRLLGFLGGGDDLSKVVKLSTFVDDTAARIGPGQPTNQSRRLTWNAAADWSVEFGEVQFEILAKDGRGLMPVHWITLPASGALPALTISQRPVAEAEWLHLWYWLIATDDPDVVLSEGQIIGAGGAFAGQVLATTENSISTTTEAGRAYLSAKIGARVITEAEIARGGAGQFGLSEVTALSLVKVVPAP